jgi:hypothetical protein
MTTTDRTPQRTRRNDAFPNDPNAEADLLASAMHTRDALEVLATVPIAAFYTPRHAAVAEVLVFALEQGWRPDRTLILDELERIGIIDDAGGAAVVFELYGRTPATGNAPKYAEAVLRHWRARQWAGVGLEIAERAKAGEVAGILSEVLPRVDELIAGATKAGPTYANVKALLAGELVEDPPTILERDDGVALFYRGALNYLHGEPGKGKSWVALKAAAALLEEGEPVVILDFEDTARNVIGRFRTLGVGEHVLREHLFYVEDPHNRPLRELVRLALDVDPTLVLIDGVAASMTAVDLDEDKSSDVNAWIDTLTRPLAAYGAAVIAVDHVTKSKESRGLWPRGSGAKRARIDGAAYSVEAVEPFTRQRSGKLKLILAKDRRGFIGGEGQVVAMFKVTPHRDGAFLDVKVDTPRAQDSLDGSELEGAGPGVRADLADLLVEILEADFREGPLSSTTLEDKVRSRWLGRSVGHKSINATLQWLKNSGRVELRIEGRARRWALPPRQGGLRLIPGADPDDPGPSEPPPDDTP